MQECPTLFIVRATFPMTSGEHPVLAVLMQRIFEGLLNWGDWLMVIMIAPATQLINGYQKEALRTSRGATFKHLKKAPMAVGDSMISCQPNFSSSPCTHTLPVLFLHSCRIVKQRRSCLWCFERGPRDPPLQRTLVPFPETEVSKRGVHV